MDECAACGHGLRPAAKFCDECGAAVAPTRPAGERKQVTVLFGDVVGSMKLAATLDPERLQHIMHEVFNRSAVIVQRYGGTVDKFTGDGLMALFGAPVALEDHALRACIAALEIQSIATQFAAEVQRRDNIDLQIRIGLNSGEVIAGEIGSGYTAVGHPVGLAQRMEAAAPPGGVLLSHTTATLVDHAAQLGALRLVDIKGDDNPMPAYQLEAVHSDQHILARDDGPMLGRDAELAALEAAFATSGRMIGIVGAAGLGKSRLVREFSVIAADTGAAVIAARCEAHATDVAFHAWRRLLRSTFGIVGLDSAAARVMINEQLGAFLAPGSIQNIVLFDLLAIADTDSPPIDLTADVRRRRIVEVMAMAAKSRPSRILFVLEDVHWIDRASEEVIADFAKLLPQSQSTLAVNFRPEYGGALRAGCDVTVPLEALQGSTAVDLVIELIGSDPANHPLAEQIARHAAGNPFFVEEIVRDLFDRRVIVGTRGAYHVVGSTKDISIPATVQSVIAARIDRLSPQSKNILNAAAVIGSRFDLDTLAMLVPAASADRLAELTTAELIDQTAFLPLPRYAFRHPLIRTVAYESQLTSTRADAHCRLATALQQDNNDDSAALIATHLDAAGEAEQAYQWWMRSGAWLARLSPASARSGWQRAGLLADGLADDHPHVVHLRTAPRTMLALTSYFGGDTDASDRNFAELRDLTERSGDLLSLASGMAGHCILLSQICRIPQAAQLAGELAELIDRIDGNDSAKHEILSAVVWVQFLDCNLSEATRNAERQLALTAPPATNRLAIMARANVGLLNLMKGDHFCGWRDLFSVTTELRDSDPIGYAQITAYVGGLVSAGHKPADEMLEQSAEAVAMADEAGDRFARVDAHWARGVALFLSAAPQYDVAAEHFRLAREIILEMGNPTMVLAQVDTYLALQHHRDGPPGSAVDALRLIVDQHTDVNSPLFVGVPADALVSSLVDRGSPHDLDEARAVIGRFETTWRPLAVPTLEFWLLRWRTLVAKASGDRDDFADSARRYLAFAERLGARGRLDEAHQLVAETT